MSVGIIECYVRAKWMVLYFRLKNDKFWIEQDMTEDGIANRLLSDGVPKEDIVLAFHEPAMWQYTEFATAGKKLTPNDYNRTHFRPAHDHCL